MSIEELICDECGSGYFKDSSEMMSLCPECAHRLYGYTNCEHQLENNRCIKCGWNGRVSDYLQ